MVALKIRICFSSLKKNLSSFVKLFFGETVMGVQSITTIAVKIRTFFFQMHKKRKKTLLIILLLKVMTLILHNKSKRISIFHKNRTLFIYYLYTQFNFCFIRQQYFFLCLLRQHRIGATFVSKDAHNEKQTCNLCSCWFKADMSNYGKVKVVLLWH